MHAEQIAPDKNVNFHYTTAAFTLSPESKGFDMLCAGLPGDHALYAVSVRLPVRCTQAGQLIVLHSNFLRTVFRDFALVFG